MPTRKISRVRLQIFLETQMMAAQRNGRDDASFPLTPALSPRERENRWPVLRHTGAPEWFQNPDRVGSLPLPEGEGWGEGERGVRVPSVYACSEQFTER